MIDTTEVTQEERTLTERLPSGVHYRQEEPKTYFTGEPITLTNEPLGLEGDKRHIEDYVRSDSAIRSLIANKGIKGVPVYTSYGAVRGVRYIIPLRRGEVLVTYEQDHPVPIRTIFDDDLDHSFISYYYRKGREVSLVGNDSYDG